jgi:hypothetical protein
MLPYCQQRTELLHELGKLKRLIKRRPYLAMNAEAITFRLRELRQLERITQTNFKAAGGSRSYS